MATSTKLAPAIGFIEAAEGLPLAGWMAVVLPRYRHIACTDRFADAAARVRSAVAMRVDGGAFDPLAGRLSHAAGTIAWLALRVPYAERLDWSVMRDALTSAALAVQVREQLPPEDLALLYSPFQPLIPIESVRGPRRFR